MTSALLIDFGPSVKLTAGLRLALNPAYLEDALRAAKIADKMLAAFKRVFPKRRQQWEHVYNGEVAPNPDPPLADLWYVHNSSNLRQSAGHSTFYLAHHNPYGKERTQKIMRGLDRGFRARFLSTATSKQGKGNKLILPGAGGPLFRTLSPEHLRKQIKPRFGHYYSVKFAHMMQSVLLPLAEQHVNKAWETAFNTRLALYESFANAGVQVDPSRTAEAHKRYVAILGSIADSGVKTRSHGVNRIVSGPEGFNFYGRAGRSFDALPASLRRADDALGSVSSTKKAAALLRKRRKNRRKP